ncbi:hypothetical protein [uncultured Maritimibacter sp.]|jgi:hypothetical protein|uniref:hypothetical protein n=1 Tax=uncultured Maritimibacter sp. TaxID=991866 RepID=UPI00260BEE2B|nr:hypothetical protein [uncultured Maritimibacter sp.]
MTLHPTPLAAFLARLDTLAPEDRADAMANEALETDGSFFPTSKSQPRATLHGVCAHGTDTDDLVTNWIAAARKILHRDAMLEAATRALYDADTLNDALAEACHAILRHSTEASLRMAAQSELDRLARDAAARTAA